MVWAKRGCALLAAAGGFRGGWVARGRGEEGSEGGGGGLSHHWLPCLLALPDVFLFHLLLLHGLNDAENGNETTQRKHRQGQHVGELHLQIREREPQQQLQDEKQDGAELLLVCGTPAACACGLQLVDNQ